MVVRAAPHPAALSSSPLGSLGNGITWPTFALYHIAATLRRIALPSHFPAPYLALFYPALNNTRNPHRLVHMYNTRTHAQQHHGPARNVCIVLPLSGARCVRIPELRPALPTVSLHLRPSSALIVILHVRVPCIHYLYLSLPTVRCAGICRVASPCALPSPCISSFLAHQTWLSSSQLARHHRLRQ